MWIKAKVDSCQNFASIHILIKNLNTFGLILAIVPNLMKFFTLTGIDVLITIFTATGQSWLYKQGGKPCTLEMLCSCRCMKLLRYQKCNCFGLIGPD